MLKRLHGTLARVCNKECFEAFREDRRAGLCYGLHRINGIICQHREEYSVATCTCAYCGEPVKGKIPKHLQHKFALPGTIGIIKHGDCTCLLK